MADSAPADELQQKLVRYRPSSQTIALIRQTPIVLLVGVSGAGKNSVNNKLLAGSGYHPIVSHTTRPPRANNGIVEQDGREYHFVSLAEAERMLDAQAFVEAKIYGGNVYGTSVAEIQAAHDERKIALADIEVQGVAEYKAIADSIQAIFLLPPSYEVWQQRLAGRYKQQSADAADLNKRLQIARNELQEALDKGYFQFVINDDLERAVAAVDAIAHDAPRLDIAENVSARRVAQNLLDRLSA